MLKGRIIVRRSVQEQQMVDAKSKLLQQGYYETMQTTSLHAEITDLLVQHRVVKGSELELAHRTGMPR